MNKDFFKKLKNSVFEFSYFKNDFRNLGVLLFHLPTFAKRNLFLDEEMVFSKSNEILNLAENKKILIVGGGPSTNNLNFDNLDYDSIWSTNHFFKHQKLKNIKIDLISIMNNVDLNDKNFLEYKSKFSPLVGFEYGEKLLTTDFDNYHRYFFFHSRFYSKLGSCPRLIILACFAGAKKIHFSGMDGIKFIKQGNHAFEPGKTDLPMYFDEQICKDQYSLFWKYIKCLFPDVEFLNLGYGQEYHSF